MVEFMRTSVAALACAVCLSAAGDPASLEQLFTRPFSWGTPPSEVTWSHDGHRLAFLWNAEGQPFLDLYAYNPDEHKLTRLTDMKSVHDTLNASELSKDERLKRYQLPDTGLNSFNLSNDGAQLAFTLEGDLYTVPADGSAKPFRLTRTKVAESAPQFSPNGKQLSFIRGGQLFAQDLATGQLTQIADADGVASYKWSPDGKQVFYSTRAPGGNRQLLLPIYSGRVVTRVTWLAMNPDKANCSRFHPTVQVPLKPWTTVRGDRKYGGRCPRSGRRIAGT